MDELFEHITKDSIEFKNLDAKASNLLSFIESWEGTRDIKIILPNEVMRKINPMDLELLVSSGMVAKVHRPQDTSPTYYFNPELYTFCLRRSVELYSEANVKGYKEGYDRAVAKAKEDLKPMCAEYLAKAILDKLL